MDAADNSIRSIKRKTHTLHRGREDQSCQGTCIIRADLI